MGSDWERVIVVHSRDADNMWAPSRALLSAHSGYHNLAWGDIHSTLSTDEVRSADKPPTGGKDKDHPMVYVAWSKHAHFDTTNTLWIGPIAQSTDNAFRSDDWWHYVEQTNYVSVLLDSAVIYTDGVDSIGQFHSGRTGLGTHRLGVCDE